MLLANCPAKAQKSINISSDNTTIKYYSSILDIEQSFWAQAAPKHNIFLQYEYLSLLEKCPPKGISFAYCMFLQNNAPLGVGYFQIKDFDVADSLKSSVEKGKIPLFASKLAQSLNFYTLVAGNLLLTGEHGFYFSPMISEELKNQLQLQAIELVKNELATEQRKPSLFFVKDFFNSEEQFLENKYEQFDFQPNMQLPIRSNWLSMDDYLEDMTTKYRTRAKRAFKKFNGLIRYELDEMLIERHQEEMYALYLKIANNVGFNLVEMHPNYFLEMKRTFGEKYEIWGVFDQNRLIGFYSTLLNYNELETGFLGFEEEYNPSHQLYLNFLYDMVRQGIEKKVHTIIFARTAMEIKSSIGAEPIQMHTYIKHKSTFVNYALPTLIKWLSPPMDWVQRKPFKEEGVAIEA